MEPLKNCAPLLMIRLLPNEPMLPLIVTPPVALLTMPPLTSSTLPVALPVPMVMDCAPSFQSVPARIMRVLFDELLPSVLLALETTLWPPPITSVLPPSAAVLPTFSPPLTTNIFPCPGALVRYKLLPRPATAIPPTLVMTPPAKMFNVLFDDKPAPRVNTPRPRSHVAPL